MSIQYTGNAIYFKIATINSELGDSYKIICLSPRRTRQIFAWAGMQPVYLKVSSHDSLALANRAALKIQEELKTKKGVSILARFEIWSRRVTSEKTRYVIVLEHSNYLINKNRVEIGSKVLNTPLVAISSRGLLERWYPHAKLGEKK